MSSTGSDNCSPEEHVLGPMEEVGDALANTGDRDSLPGSDSVDDGAVVDPEQKRESGGTVWKIKMFNRFIDETLTGLPSTAAVLWLTLFRFERQGIARASLNTLAKRMGVDRKTVDRNMRLLYKHKLIKKERQGGIGKGSNVYRLGLLPLEPRAKPQRRSKTTKHFQQSKPK